MPDLPRTRRYDVDVLRTHEALLLLPRWFAGGCWLDSTPKERLAITEDDRRASDFVLLELLTAVGIGLLPALFAPAFTGIRTGTKVSDATYTLEDIAESAVTCARENNGHIWARFCEEDVSQSSGNPTTGLTSRLIAESRMRAA